MKHRPYIRTALCPSVAGFLALLVPALAHAHIGVGQIAGFAHGFEHPLGGIDHVLAMVAVGLWAAQRGERTLWLIPAAFVLAMTFGGALGSTGIVVPFVEQGIVLSVLLLGVFIAAAVRLPMLASALIVGVFALFHGHAHGAEMPANASGLAYGAGFLLATACLHGLGIAVALFTRGLGRTSLVRFSGGVIAASGMYLWLTA
jgi:urease accessory protein